MLCEGGPFDRSVPQSEVIRAIMCEDSPCSVVWGAPVKLHGPRDPDHRPLAKLHEPLAVGPGEDVAHVGPELAEVGV